MALVNVEAHGAQRLGPREKKQGVQVVGLGVDFDRRTAEAFERAAHIGMEVGANLVRQGSTAVLRREDEMNVEFGEGLRHAGDSSTGLPICQAGFSRPFRPHCVGISLPRASAFGLSPGLGSPDPLGRCRRPEKCGVITGHSVRPRRFFSRSQPLALGEPAEGFRCRGPRELPGLEQRRTPWPSQANGYSRVAGSGRFPQILRRLRLSRPRILAGIESVSIGAGELTSR